MDSSAHPVVQNYPLSAPDRWVLGKPMGDVFDMCDDRQAVRCPGGLRVFVGLLAEYPDEAEAGQVTGERPGPQAGQQAGQQVPGAGHRRHLAGMMPVLPVPVGASTT
ncbi:MAG: hypothetical protein ACRDNW_11875 [Trebonia sp.]